MLEKFFERLLGKKAEKPERTTEAEPEAKEEKSNFQGYGLGMMGFLLSSGDYGWTEPEKVKKTIMVNPLECKERVTFMGLVSAWRGTGHSEWEALLAGTFLKEVMNAIKENRKECDITFLFDRDLIARGDRKYTKEQIVEHLAPWFEIVSDSVEERRVRLKLENKKAA